MAAFEDRESGITSYATQALSRLSQVGVAIWTTQDRDELQRRRLSTQVPLEAHGLDPSSLKIWETGRLFSHFRFRFPRCQTIDSNRW